MAETASSIKNFSEFGITTKRSFEGHKIYAEDLLEQEIIVHFFEIRPSRKNDGSECLFAQITFCNEKRLFLSGSRFLMEDLKRIPDNGFPFKVKIIRVNRHFEFRGV